MWRPTCTSFIGSDGAHPSPDDESEAGERPGYSVPWARSPMSATPFHHPRGPTDPNKDLLSLTASLNLGRWLRDDRDAAPRQTHAADDQLSALSVRHEHHTRADHRVLGSRDFERDPTPHSTRSARPSTSASGIAISFGLQSGRDERLRERRTRAQGEGPTRGRRAGSGAREGSPRTTFVISAAPGSTISARLKSDPQTEVLKRRRHALSACTLRPRDALAARGPTRLVPGRPGLDTTAMERVKSSVSRHAHVFAVRGFAAVAALLVIKGVVGHHRLDLSGDIVSSVTPR